MGLNYHVIIPSVVQGYTDACFASLAPAVQANTSIIDNSQTNIGVPASWNVGVRYVLDNNIDYLVIVSAAMRFQNGLRDLAAKIESEQDAWGIDTQHGWHCIALSRKVFAAVGLFDETFFPAYYEDTDFIRRMELAGIHSPVAAYPSKLLKIDIDATCVEVAHAYKSGVHVDFLANRAYFIKKWGAESSYKSQSSRDKLFPFPFNNPANTLAYW